MSYRIISMDGGGIRGALIASILHRLIKKYPELIDKTDLLAGTSTGGLIALTLASGTPAQNMMDLYKVQGPYIFGKKRWPLWNLWKAKFGSDRLRESLVKLTGEDARLIDLKKKVLVTAFQLSSEEGRWGPRFLHNYPDSGPGESEMKVIDAGMATAAAPTYFPSWKKMIDGGVIASNPSLNALILALDDKAGQSDLQDVKLLSFGTGDTKQQITGDKHDWGAGRWATRIIPVLTDGTVSVPHSGCKRLLDERYFRVNPPLEKAIDMADAKAIPGLIELGNKVNLKELESWIENEFLV